MLMLSMVLVLVGFNVIVCGVALSVADPPLIVTLPLNEPVVAVSGDPSSDITM
jgi:hypothetical protein